MSPAAAVYFLVLIVGGVRTEIQSNPGLTAAKCYAAGEEWVAGRPDHKYECRRMDLARPAKAHK